MLNYASLSMPFKTLLVTVLFLSLCTGVCTSILVGRKQGKLCQLFLILSTASLAAMMLLYTSIIPAERAKPNIPSIAIGFAELPVLFPVLLWLLILFFLIHVIVTEIKRRSTAITLSSIKESLDHLQTGLCFSLPNGLILLSNHRMNELSHQLFGQPLQNANLFWKALQSGETASGVSRLSASDHPEFSLADDSIWTFKFEKLDSVIQITAAQTTRQHQLLSELQVRNRELEAMSERIRSYGEKVDEYITARERLDTRVNLHGFLGQSLLMTRHYLQSKTGDRQNILDIWQHNVDILRLEAEPQQEADSLASLQSAAKAIGMQVHVHGSLPPNPSHRRLIASIGAETLTNAVRHAGATQLFIDAEETNTTYVIRYTNDGVPPDHAVSEGGGLGSARRKSEAAGATMQSEASPRFALILSFEQEVMTHV